LRMNGRSGQRSRDEEGKEMLHEKPRSGSREL
jgi:hypothetical protein